MGKKEDMKGKAARSLVSFLPCRVADLMIGRLQLARDLGRTFFALHT